MRSFFQRESESAPATPPPPKTVAAPPKARTGNRETTHLANGSKIVGEISGNAELIIDGQVEGQIDLQNRVVVGGQGRVQGKIVAATVEVGGKVHGNVRGLQKVEVLTTGSLEGDVSAPRVVIAEGAFFKGKIEMTDPAPEPAPAKASPASAPPPKPAAAETPPKPSQGDQGGASDGRKPSAKASGD